MRIQEIIVRIQDAIEGKKKWQKKWRAHVARVKALPQDYQIVYNEIQKYLFKVGPVELTDGTDFLSGDLLSGIIDLFEEGAALGKGVLEVTGSDVAAFCDDLIKDSKTFADILQESVDQEVNKAKKKVTDKTK
jgi:DNA-binding ferritin-like protein (Dps family)